MAAFRRLLAIVALTALTPLHALAVWPPNDDASPKEVVEALVSEVRRLAIADTEPARRAWAWRALQRAEVENVTDLAERATNEPSTAVRRRIVRSLERFAGYANSSVAWAAQATLTRSLNDPDDLVKQSAAQGLLTFGERHKIAAGPDCVALLCDANEIVREGRLKSLPDHARDDALMAAFISGSPNVQQWVLTRLSLKTLAVDEIGLLARVATASTSAEVRRWGLEHGSPNDAEYRRRLLIDADPANVATAFRWAESKQFSHLVRCGLRHPNPAVVAAAKRAATNQPDCIVADRGTLTLWIATGKPANVDMAAAVFVALDEKALTPDDQQPSIRRGQRFAQEWLAAFRSAHQKTLARRVAAVWLSEFVCRAYVHLPGTVQGTTGPLTRIVTHASDAYWDEVPTLWRIESAFPFGAEAASVFSQAIDDSDPCVRRAACLLLAAVAEGGTSRIGPCDERAEGWWERVFSRCEDPDLDVRRVVSAQLGRAMRSQYSQMFRDGIRTVVDRNPLAETTSLTKMMHDAARRMLDDPDLAIARRAAHFCIGDDWDAAAGPLMVAELESGPPPDADRLIATLLAHAPELLSLDFLAQAVARDATSDEPRPFEADWPALRALLGADALDRYFALVEQSHDEHAYAMVSDLFSLIETSAQGRLIFDAADVADVIAFANRLDPTRCEVLGSLVHQVSRPPIGRPDLVRAWASDAATPISLRYAAMESPLLADAAEVYQRLDSPDAIVCLLAFASLTDRASLAAIDDPPPSASSRQKILVNEVKRDRTGQTAAAPIDF